jgi:hypothetical protein
MIVKYFLCILRGLKIVNFHLILELNGLDKISSGAKFLQDTIRHFLEMLSIFHQNCNILEVFSKGGTKEFQGP